MKSITYNKRTKGLAAVVVGNRVVMVKSGKAVEVTVPNQVQAVPIAGIKVSTAPIPTVTPAELPSVLMPVVEERVEVTEETTNFPEIAVGAAKVEEPKENITEVSTEESSPEPVEEKFRKKGNKGKSTKTILDNSKEGE